MAAKRGAKPPAAKPVVQLTGQDGNAAIILVRCRKAAKRAGWTDQQIERFMAKAKGGDYANLLAVCEEHFDIC